MSSNCIDLINNIKTAHQVIGTSGGDSGGKRSSPKIR